MLGSQDRELGHQLLNHPAPFQLNHLLRASDFSRLTNVHKNLQIAAEVTQSRIHLSRHVIQQLPSMLQRICKGDAPLAGNSRRNSRTGQTLSDHNE